MNGALTVIYLQRKIDHISQSVAIAVEFNIHFDKDILCVIKTSELIN